MAHVRNRLIGVLTVGVDRVLTDLKELQPLAFGLLNVLVDIKLGLYGSIDECRPQSSPFAACMVSCVVRIRTPSALYWRVLSTKACLH